MPIHIKYKKHIHYMQIPPQKNSSSPTFILSRPLTDVLKISAAMLVAMGHYSGHASHFVINPIYQFFAAVGGYVGVAIFFLLSGYGLMMSEQKSHLKFWAFCKRRLSKIYYPVVLVSSIWGLVMWPKDGGLDYIPSYMITALFTFGDGVLWFVQVIAMQYLLFEGYVCMRIRFKRFSLAYLILVTVLAYVIVFVTLHDWCALSVPMFSIGVLVSDYNKILYKFIHGYGVLLWLVIITVIMAGLYHVYGNLYAHALFNYYVVTAIVAFCAFWSPSFKIRGWIGDFSYDIYLTHNKLIQLLKPNGELIGLHIFIIGTVVFSTASYTIRHFLLKES